jgi:NADH-quinone oxidoreductase subunit N
MTWGNVAALAQSNVKRMLAYSSIGHAGYILIALAVATPLGFAGGFIHILAYVFMTGGAFAVVSFFSNTYNAHTYEDYKGLRDLAPVTSLAMVFFLLSLAGVPPLAGFLSKFILFAAAIGANMVILAIFGIINSAVSLYYYAHVMKNLYFRELPKKVEKKPEPKLFLFLIVASVVLTFVIFLDSGRYLDLTMNAARAIL